MTAKRKDKDDATGFLSYEEARKAVKDLGLSSSTQWRRYCQAGKRPDNLPSDPSLVYKNNGWKGWRHFFSKPEKRFLPYTKARKIVHGLGIGSSNEWWDYIKANDLPEGVPTRPDRTYKESGDWKGWADFIGTEKKAKKAA